MCSKVCKQWAFKLETAFSQSARKMQLTLIDSIFLVICDVHMEDNVTHTHTPHILVDGDEGSLLSSV